MKKNYIYLIVWCFAVLFLPIAYYYWYALPKLERDKFEYQIEKDRKAEEKKEQEQKEAERKETEKLNNYTNCKARAVMQYDLDLESVCEASYNFCKESVVDSWNNLWLTPKKTYAECEQHKMKDWQCVVMSNLNNWREKRYKEALEECDKLLKL